ncbi:unnamed protein product [Clonostachys rosea]|uniref:ER-bound oxygenase mpaB/mpaB'/Rubber oxygenase catalytic domain-containing protein n=1 Tax=Bionectria ochroleuca TaxID=29856 RepID=A0ABY6U856_BIOOC|nr:unnamed protein product [Clonostachys rosea]
MSKIPTQGEYLDWYGFKFRWTSYHQTPDQLNHYIYSYDTLSTEALEALDKLSPPAPIAPRKDIQTAYEPKDKSQTRDFFKLVQNHKNEDPAIQALWNEVNTVPEWVDWDEIERGQKVFWRYAGPAITALTHLSLLGGMASGRTVETLDRTGGFGARAVKRRLMETVQHTFGVHKDLESIQPGGEGWEASVRVRLLHSSVRRRIMQLAQEKPEYYSVKDHGVPVNDLDCIGTINTFSSTVIWLGYPRQGIFLSKREILDYLALWRYVAYLMGTPHDWMATPELAKAMMESLLVSEYRPTKKSATLANNIITGFEGEPPIYASRGYINALTWWLNGPQLARVLEIEKPSLYHYALVASQCWHFMLISYITSSIPILDRLNIDFLKRSYYDAFVFNKKKGALGYKARFSFKWIPDLVNTTTPLGITDEERWRVSGAFGKGTIEKTALFQLLLSTITLFALVYYGWTVLHRSTRVVN